MREPLPAADRPSSYPSSSRAGPNPPGGPPRRIAVLGAGIAGIACARTLHQAGHQVHVFEREDRVGGRTTSELTPFGRFDSGAQYFTVRDERFRRALEVAGPTVRPWSATLVRVLDPHGRVAEAPPPSPERHWVAQPGMDALAQNWAAPLADALHLDTRVARIERDALAPTRWQLRTEASDGAVQVHAGFDDVLLCVAPSAARTLLADGGWSPALDKALKRVTVEPCWTLMLAFPQASPPALGRFGPQWNAARSTHHRVAWLARDSSKPGREPVERWTVQASPEWSAEHLQDDRARVEAKLLRAFSEITGVRAEPGYAKARCWREARTAVTAGKPHLWDAKRRIGLAGDWCLGHRVEDAFLSGLSLALAVA